jgi:hypothetical protein
VLSPKRRCSPEYRLEPRHRLGRISGVPNSRFQWARAGPLSIRDAWNQPSSRDSDPMLPQRCGGSLTHHGTVHITNVPPDSDDGGGPPDNAIRQDRPSLGGGPQRLDSIQ